MVRVSNQRNDNLKKGLYRRCRSCIVIFPLLVLITMAIALLYMSNSGKGVSTLDFTQSIDLLCAGVKHGMASGKVVDIDIGTWGRYETRQADILLTFDPFDEPLMTDKMERYPYAIGDYNGTGVFYENLGARDCSTMNGILHHVNQTTREDLMAENCGFRRDMPGARRCAQPLPDRVNQIQVQVRRLCDILKMRGFIKVNVLKIDAQGSDFAILKDVVENCPHVEINSLKIECQFYNRTVPLYLTDNDCDRMELYLRDKFPSVDLRFEMNVCWSAEYNLLATNLKRPW